MHFPTLNVGLISRTIASGPKALANFTTQTNLILGGDSHSFKSHANFLTSFVARLVSGATKLASKIAHSVVVLAKTVEHAFPRPEINPAAAIAKRLTGEKQTPPILHTLSGQPRATLVAANSNGNQTNSALALQTTTSKITTLKNSRTLYKAYAKAATEIRRLASSLPLAKRQELHALMREARTAILKHNEALAANSLDLVISVLRSKGSNESKLAAIKRLLQQLTPRPPRLDLT